MGGAGEAGKHFCGQLDLPWLQVPSPFKFTQCLSSPRTSSINITALGGMSRAIAVSRPFYRYGTVDLLENKLYGFMSDQSA